MITDHYMMAGRTIRVTSLYDRVHGYCRDYRTGAVADPDIDVVISDEDIVYERERSEEPGAYSDEYLEELAVYRKISEKMPFFDTFLMHGSVVAVDGEAYMFTAVSGTGKSTHAALWRRYLGDRAVMVNDDKPLVSVKNGTVTVYGTPYNGKHRLGSNISVPLKAVCVIDRGEDNSIQEVRGRDVYPVLMQQIYRPADKDALIKTLQLTDRLVKNVKFYKLRCNMDITAAETAYNAMKG